MTTVLVPRLLTLGGRIVYLDIRSIECCIGGVRLSTLRMSHFLAVHQLKVHGAKHPFLLPRGTSRDLAGYCRGCHDHDLVRAQRRTAHLQKHRLTTCYSCNLAVESVKTIANLGFEWSWHLLANILSCSNSFEHWRPWGVHGELPRLLPHISH